MNVHYLWQYTFMKKRYNLKWAYVKNRDEFATKFKIKYPEFTDQGVANFIRIYLMYEPAEHNYGKSKFLFDDLICISRICVLSPYLAQTTDYNYDWMIENNSSGIHFP